MLSRWTLCLHASWTLLKLSHSPPSRCGWTYQPYVPVPEPVPEHDGMPLMISHPHPECVVTCEILRWYQRSRWMVTLPRRPTTIPPHLPVSWLGTTVFVADAAIPVTVAAITSRARTSAATVSVLMPPLG